MPYNERTPSGSGAASATSYPIARCFAFTVLAALILLILLRHLFGSVAVQVGTR
jgi:hypothetical protein